MEVHRCRFMNYERPHVTALEFNKSSPGNKSMPDADLKLAVGRANGDIELWSPQHSWTLDCVLHGAKERAIEDLSWACTDGHSRLFSVGGSDSITEWDLATGMPLQHTSADAGVIWAIETSPDGKKIAVACETGTIVLFDLENGAGSLMFGKRLVGADASLTSLAWKGNDFLVAGAADARLRVWSIKESRIIGTMKVDKAKSEQAIVWSVKVLKHGQIVSGDSNGCIKFWDGKTLSLQQSLQAHPTDILTLASDVNGETLFSSGLDQKIVCIKMTDEKLKRWTLMSSRVAHSHDIRCLTAYEARNTSFLVSGGLESAIVVSSIAQFEDKPFRKLPLANYLPQYTQCSDYIVEWNEQLLKVWYIGVADQTKRLVAELHVNDSDDFISSAALSATKNMLAVATMNSIKLYKLEGLSSGSAVTKIERQEAEELMGGARLVKFVNADSLLIVTPQNDMDIYSLAKNMIQEVSLAPQGSEAKQNQIPWLQNISRVFVSPDGKQFITSKNNNRLDVYLTSKAAYAFSLPKPNEQITTAIYRSSNLLTVFLADTSIVEFDLKQKGLSAWSREHSSRLPSQLANQTTPVMGAFKDPQVDSRVWFWGASFLSFMDFAPKSPYRKPTKRKNVNVGSKGNANANANANDDDEDETEVGVTTTKDEAPQFFLTHKYKPIFFACNIKNTIFVSEKPPMQSNSRPFWSNRFIKI